MAEFPQRFKNGFVKISFVHNCIGNQLMMDSPFLNSVIEFLYAEIQ